MTTFVIVGAGPAGASLGLLLARHGATVHVLERESSPGGVFRGEGLMPLGLDALHQMGLGSLLDDVPGRPVQSWRLFIDGEPTLTIPEPVGELGPRAFRVASPVALLDGMLDRARALERFTYHPSTRFTGVERDVSGRVVAVQAATEAGSIRLSADLVIGCDGRGSSVRTHAGLVLQQDPASYDVVWFKASPSDELKDRCDFMIMIRGGHHPLVCYTSWDGRLQCGLVMPKGGMTELRGADWLSVALGSAPAWLADHVRTHADDVEGPLRLNVMVGFAPRWSAPGVLLLGDAAHPMSPVRAQGINLALRDVIVAANHLVPIATTAGPAALDDACQAIQAEREPEVVRAQELQRKEAAGQGDARSASWRFALAKRAARIVGGYGWAQRAWLNRQKELRFGSTPVNLTIDGQPSMPLDATEFPITGWVAAPRTGGRGRRRFLVGGAEVGGGGQGLACADLRPRAQPRTRRHLTDTTPPTRHQHDSWPPHSAWSPASSARQP